MIRQSCIQIPARLVTALSLAIAQVAPAAAQSLPTGASVQSGSAAVSTTGNVMQVNQSTNRAVINWNTFNVGANSSVFFNQPSTSSSVLNRVTGDAPSNIAGLLQGNGSVYIINPNGVAITPSGRVIMGGGFVASTLALSDADYQQGKLAFRGNGASAAVSNEGEITVGAGGVVGLLGGSVSNAGKIVAPLGRIGLGSGEQATLDLYGDGFLSIALPTSATTADGKALVDVSGSVSAAGGRVAIAAATAREALRQAVNISGEVSARGASGRNGDVMIGGGAGGAVRVSGKVSAASGADSGGARAGKVAISGQSVTLEKGAVVSARSDSATGGAVHVTGETIRVAQATIDASGETGGGVVRIGGDRQGGDALPRALTTEITNEAIINADARGNGKGGDVVVWADGLTTYAGLITARGGANGGDGGEAEVSGKALLDFKDAGRVDLSAAKGASGTLLLDPYNIIIADPATTPFSGNTFTGSATDSTISASTISGLLLNNDVAISTAGNAAGGDISVNSAISWSSARKLTLTAATGTITVNNTITFSNGSANLALNARNFLLASTGAISTGGTVTGAFTGAANIEGTISGGGPNINLNATSINVKGSGSNSISMLTSTWTTTGDISFDSAAGLSLFGVLTLNAANVNINGSTFSGSGSVVAATGASGKMTLSSASLTLNSLTASWVEVTGSNTLAITSITPLGMSRLSGSGALVKRGPGVLTVGNATGFTGSISVGNGFVDFTDKASFTSATMLSKLTVAPVSGASATGVLFRFNTGASTTSDFGWADVANALAVEKSPGVRLFGAGTSIGVDTTTAAQSLDTTAVTSMTTASSNGLSYAANVDFAKLGDANDLTIAGSNGAAGPWQTFKTYSVLGGYIRANDAVILNNLATRTSKPIQGSSVAGIAVGIAAADPVTKELSASFIDTSTKFQGLRVSLDANLILVINSNVGAANPSTDTGALVRKITGLGQLKILKQGTGSITLADYFFDPAPAALILGDGVQVSATIPGVADAYLPGLSAVAGYTIKPTFTLTIPGDLYLTASVSSDVAVNIIKPATSKLQFTLNADKYGLIGDYAGSGALGTVAERTAFKANARFSGWTWFDIAGLDTESFASLNVDSNNKPRALGYVKVKQLTMDLGAQGSQLSVEGVEVTRGGFNQNGTQRNLFLSNITAASFTIVGNGNYTTQLDRLTASTKAPDGSTLYGAMTIAQGNFVRNLTSLSNLRADSITIGTAAANDWNTTATITGNLTADNGITFRNINVSLGTATISGKSIAFVRPATSTDQSGVTTTYSQDIAVTGVATLTAQTSINFGTGVGGVLPIRGSGTLVLNNAIPSGAAIAVALPNSPSFTGSIGVGAGVNATLNDIAGGTTGLKDITVAAGGKISFADTTPTDIQRITGAVSGAGVIENIGAATLNLTSTATLASGSKISVTSGALSLNGAVVDGNVDVASAGIVNFSPTGTTQTFNGVLSGAGVANVSKATTFSGQSNAFSGSIAVAASVNLIVTGSLGGAVALNNLSRLTGSGAGTYSLATSVTGGGVTVTSGVAQIGALATTTIANDNTYAGALNVQLGATLAVTGAGQQTFSTPALSLSGSVTGAGALAFSDARSLASVTAAGDVAIAINDGGGIRATVLSANITSTNGNVSIGTYTQIGDNVTLKGVGVTSAAVASVSLSTGKTLTIDNSAGSSFSAVMSGDGAFTKLGAGILTLTSANTYTGPTTISAGTLALTGNGGLGTSVVANNAALTVTTTRSISFGAVSSFAQIAGAVSGSGTIDVSAGAVYVNDALSSTNATATNAIKIAASGSVAIGGNGSISGKDPVVSGASLINNKGASAITATSGRWLVYLASDTGNTYGGLDSGNAAVWNRAALAAVSETGKRYVFANKGVLTATVSKRKTYGDEGTLAASDITAFAGTRYNGEAGAYSGMDANALRASVTLTSAGSDKTADANASGYAIVASSTDYTITTSGTFVVDRKQLGGLTAQTRVYDGTTTAAIDATSVTGVVNNDALGYSGIYATADAGPAKAVTVTITGAKAGNYLAPTNVTGIVDKRIVKVKANDKTLTYGDANTFNGVTVADRTSTDGLVGLETVTLSSFTLASTEADAAKSGAGLWRARDTAYAITVGAGSVAGSNGFKKENYTFATTDGALTVAKKAITYSGVAASDKFYDGALTATVTGSLGGVVSGDAVNTSGPFGDANASSTAKAVTVTVGGADKDNYSISGSATLFARIKPKALTITANDMNVEYGAAALGSAGFTTGTNQFVGLEKVVSVSYATNAPLSGSGNLTVSGTTPWTITPSAAVGANGFVASNYDIKYQDGSATIRPKTLDYGTLAGTSRVYDGTKNVTLTGSQTGLIAGDNASAKGAYASADAGDSKTILISLIGTDANNYRYDTGLTAPTGSVSKRALTITANDISRTYGDGNIFAGYSIATPVGDTGLVTGETVTNVTLAINSGVSTGGFWKASASGTPWKVTASNATGATFNANNYGVEYKDGSATISRLAVTVSGISAAPKTYDGDASAALTGATPSGLTGDRLSLVLPTNAKFDSADAGSARTVALRDTSGFLYGIGGDDGANYTVAANSQASATGSIAQAQLVLRIATGKEMIYGSGNTFDGVTATAVSGLAQTDTIAPANVSYTTNAGASLSTSGNWKVGSYDLSIASIASGAGFNANNYVLSTQTNGSQKLVVTPKALDGSSLSVASKVYDGTTDAAITWTGGKVGNDQLNVTARGAFASADAGDRVSVLINPDASSVTGADAGNYRLVTSATNFFGVIQKRSLTIAANDQSRNFAAANPELTYRVGGLGLVRPSDLTGALFTEADLVSPPGKYAIQRGTLAATANYDVSFTPGEMTVISTGSVAEPVKGPTEVKLGIVVPPWRDPAPTFRTEVFTTLPTASIPAAAASTSTASSTGESVTAAAQTAAADAPTGSNSLATGASQSTEALLGVPKPVGQGVCLGGARPLCPSQ